MPWSPALEHLYTDLSHHWPAPSSRSIFETALTRLAWTLENPMPGSQHHESLEWLGDRILGAIVADLLWQRFPYALPGQLDLLRDQLTSVGPLTEIATRLDLLSSIKKGVGEAQQQQVGVGKALSDHLEALVGAAFLSGGWTGAHAFVSKLLEDMIPEELPPADSRKSSTDGTRAISALNELLQSRWRVNLPKKNWSVQKVGGTDNDPVHQATVTLPDGTSVTGSPIRGSKSDAKADAARAALEKLQTLDVDLDPYA